MSDAEADYNICGIETTGFRSSDGEIIQPFESGSADTRIFWDEPTPLDACLKSCLKSKVAASGMEEWQILKGYYNECKRARAGYSRASNCIPEWIRPLILRRPTLDQFEAHRGQKCLLLLGNCPQYNVCTPVLQQKSLSAVNTIGPRSPNTPTSFTVEVLKAIALEFDHAIGLDVRKQCRKYGQGDSSVHYSACCAMELRELRCLLWATKLEMIVAEKDYGIEWIKCFAFSTYPCRIARFLGFDDNNIAQTPFHIADCARPEIIIYKQWKMVWMILKDITESLSRLR
ncbi:hypothetical protein MMC18_007866 [Xylographa bjoerkii]|nr:hypothetical protein [Xylographa bjoerkii]